MAVLTHALRDTGWHPIRTRTPRGRSRPAVAGARSECAKHSAYSRTARYHDTGAHPGYSVWYSLYRGWLCGYRMGHCSVRSPSGTRHGVGFVHMETNYGQNFPDGFAPPLRPRECAHALVCGRAFTQAHTRPSLRSLRAAPWRTLTRTRSCTHARGVWHGASVGAHREGLYSSCRMVAGGCGCKA